MAEFGSFDSTGGGAIVVTYIVEGAGEAVAQIETVTAAEAEQEVTTTRLAKASRSNAAASKESSFAAGLLGKGLGIITKVGKGAAVALGISAVALTLVGVHFEQQMANVAAITGAHGVQLNKLRDQAFAASLRTEYSATNAAKAEMLLGRASLKTGDILKALPATLNLATAAQGSLSDTAVLMGETLKAFAIPANQAAHVSDVLASATQNGAISMDDLIQSMKYVGAAAYASNQKIDNIVALFKLMAIHGVKGSIAGTTLRYALTRLIKPVKQVQDGLRLINLHATDLYGKKGLKPLPDILNKMYYAMQGIGKVNQGKVLVDVFGIRALSGMSALFNQGPKAWAKAIEAMRNSKGLAAKIAAEMRNTVPTQFKILTHAIEDVTSLIYLHFQPTILNSFKKVNAYFQPVIKHLGLIQGLIKQGNWQGAILYVDLLTKSHGKLAKALFVTVDFFIQLWGNVKILWNILKPFIIVGVVALYEAFRLLVGAMRLVNRYAWFIIPAAKILIGIWIALTIRTLILNTAYLLLGGTMMAVNAIMDANPVSLIIIGLVLLGVAVYYAYKHFKPFRDLVNEVWDFLSKNWKMLLISSFAGPFMIAAFLIMKYWGNIENFFVHFPSTMERVGAHMWDWMKAGFIDVLNWLIGKMNWVIGKFNDVAGLVPGVDLTMGKIGTLGPKGNPTGGGAVGPVSMQPPGTTGPKSQLAGRYGAYYKPDSTNPLPTASHGNLPPQKVEPFRTLPQMMSDTKDGNQIIQLILDSKVIAEVNAKAKGKKKARGAGVNSFEKQFGLSTSQG